MVADPPVVGAAVVCKLRSVKEHVLQADCRASYCEVTAAEQAAKQADVQSQRCGAQAAARLQQAWCGRGDEEEGMDPAEEPATHAASQSSGVALAEHAGVGVMEQDSPVSVCSSHVPNALAMRARDSMESQCDPTTEVQPGGAHAAAPPEAGGQPMADEEDDGKGPQATLATPPHNCFAAVQLCVPHQVAPQWQGHTPCCSTLASQVRGHMGGADTHW